MRRALLLTALLVACSSDATNPVPKDAGSMDGLRPDARADSPVATDTSAGGDGDFDVAAGVDGGPPTGGVDGSPVGVDATGGAGGIDGSGAGLDAAVDLASATSVDAPDVDAPAGVDASQGETGTGRADTGAVENPWMWVTVQDIEQSTCTDNAPGPDIDAVAVLDGASATVLGWGKVGSARFTAPNPIARDVCDNAECPGQDCKYATVGKTFAADTLVAMTEGPADGTVNTAADDSGYLSLNGGTLQIQTGSAVDGSGPAQAIRPGDRIMVHEIDKTYVTSGAAPSSCPCAPERYRVGLQTVKGQYVWLQPLKLAAENTTCAPLTGASAEGCGSTVFVVP